MKCTRCHLCLFVTKAIQTLVSCVLLCLLLFLLGMPLSVLEIRQEYADSKVSFCTVSTRIVLGNERTDLTPPSPIVSVLQATVDSTEKLVADLNNFNKYVSTARTHISIWYAQFLSPLL